jgi:hypothetical protein
MKRVLPLAERETEAAQIYQPAAKQNRKNTNMNKRSLIFTIAGLACLLAAGCAHRDKKQDKIIYVYVQAPNCYAPQYQDPPVPPNLDTKSLPVPPPPVAPSSVAPGAPPPPEVEVIPVRPNPAFVWVPGWWAWNGGWIWLHGYWGRPPVRGAVWIGGQWEPWHGRYVWRRGHWR